MLKTTIMVLLTSTAIGCAGAPPQVARTLQVETYHQDYIFCDVEQALRVVVYTMSDRDRVGTGPEWDGFIERFKRGPLTGRGAAQFTLALNPADRDTFFVRGHGRHDVLQRSSGELVAVVRYQVVDEGPFPLSHLDRGFVILRLNQRATRAFFLSPERHPQDVSVFVKVHLARIVKDVYTIDYSTRHELGVQLASLDASKKDPKRISTIGYMEFETPLDGRKLFDFRERSQVGELSGISVTTPVGEEVAWPDGGPCL